jgi:acetyl esterase/lipase
VLSADRLRLHSPHLNVRDNSPPHFLLHAEDDPLVSADHSLALRTALVAKKIPVETHLYARGGHGFGLRNTNGLPLDGWPERLLAFGKSTGWIKHG